jgi:endonuclease YncB( thermonuclease family)
VPRPLLALLTGVLGALSLLALAPAARAASRGPCLPGTSRPLCHVWTAKVTFIADGDTIRVKLLGDPTHAERTVRFTGINAMELSRYSRYAARRRGACHALAATTLVERAVRRSHWIVRLAAQDPRSTTGHRLRRSVFVRQGGRWRDLGRMLMEQGLALWLPNEVEDAHNLEYHRLAEEAAAAGRGLFDPDACGVGPSPEAQLAVSVNWDADGADGANLNGEWVDIRNLGATAVPLAGWWLRDSWLIYDPTHHVPGFAFPSYAVVPPGGSVRLYVGCGANTPDAPGRFYWCQRSSVFENAGNGHHSGDGGYLFDPDGDLRAYSMYPCVFRCEDPLAGKVTLSAHPTGPESVTVTNTSGAEVSLDGYLVKLHLGGAADRFIFGYPFPAGTRLGAGQRLVLWMDGSPSQDDPLDKHLGRGAYVLADGGNVVSLRSARDVVVACQAWGRDRCAPR